MVEYKKEVISHTLNASIEGDIMIFGLNREKAVSAILRLIECQDNEVLQEVYTQIGDASAVSTSTVLKVWNKIEPLDALDDAELDELLRLCLAASKLDDYKSYCVEVDTSPIKKGYIETVTGPKAKVAAMQFLELFAEHIESIYHKDLCQLSYDEAVDGLSRLPNLNAMTLRKALTVARGYCKYCVDKGEFKGKAINSFKDISISDVPIDVWVMKHIAKDPEDLVYRIQNTISINSGYIAPIALVLAWMKFSLDECIAIGVKDVNLFDKTICGRPIPDAMMPIVVSHINVTCDGDDGFLLRKTQGRKKGLPYSKINVTSALNVMNGFSYGNAAMSSALYDLYRKETETGEITEQDFVKCFGLRSDTTSFRSYLKDKQRLYSVYKRIYWTP